MTTVPPVQLADRDSASVRDTVDTPEKAERKAVEEAERIAELFEEEGR